jgi:hypothetical protein
MSTPQTSAINAPIVPRANANAATMRVVPESSIDAPMRIPAALAAKATCFKA